MAHLPLTPNWSTGVRETLEYKTDIFVSSSGKEQRRSLRSSPRRQIDFSATVFDGLHGKIAAMRTEIGKDSFYIADVTQQPLLVSGIASNSITVIHVASFTPRAGEYVVVGRQGAQHVKVLGVNAAGPFTAAFDDAFHARSVLTIDSEIAGVWDAIYPAVLGRIGVQSAFSFITDDKSSLPVSFRCLPGRSTIDTSYEAVVTLGDTEVLLARPNWASGVKLTLSVPYDEVDFGAGIIAAYRPVTFPVRTTEFAYLGRGVADASRIRDTFIRARGRAGEFWCPSWTSDLTPLSGVSAGGSNLSVNSDDLPVADKVHRGVLIVLRDGTMLPRELSDVDGGTLTFSQAIPGGIAREDIAMICWMPKCRFASDTLTIEWLTNDVAQIVINVMSVEAA